jgi:hypothetical protein
MDRVKVGDIINFIYIIIFSYHGLENLCAFEY